MNTYIWGIPTRLFHWLLTIALILTIIFIPDEHLSKAHIAFGSMVTILLIFRIFYGIFGPKYSKFKDFPMGLKNQIDFVKSYFKERRAYPGHNPLAAFVLLSIIFIGVIAGISGFLLYSVQNNNLQMQEVVLEEIHNISSHLLIFLAVIHLLGITSDLIFHKNFGNLFSIFTGYKFVESENAVITKSHKIFSYFWFFVAIVVFILSFGLKVNETGDNDDEHKTEQIDIRD